MLRLLKELTGVFGDLLEEGEKDHYMRLGERYARENSGGQNQNPEYLSMMCQPDFQVHQH